MKEEKEEYTKFIVEKYDGLALKKRIPCTGLKTALEVAGEYLKDGFKVAIWPFTQSHWKQIENMDIVKEMGD